MRVDIQQRTEAWHQWRKGKVSASNIGTIMGVNPYCTPRLLWERMKGLKPEQYETAAMRMGNSLESSALRWVEERLGEILAPLCYESDDIPFMIASCDAVSFDEDMIAEIKCSKRLYDDAVKNNRPPDMYYAQMQQQMFCSGIQVGYYCAFWDGQGHLIEVKRDDSYIKDLVVHAAGFYQSLQDNVPPPLSEKEHLVIEIDTYQKKMVENWLYARAQLTHFEELENGFRSSLCEIGDDGNIILAHEGRNLIKMTRVQQSGRVDYKKLCEDLMIDEATIRKYRKVEGIGYYRLEAVQ